MTEQTNTEVVRQAYAAFGRGDIPGVLNTLADDVEWQAVYGAASHVPTGGIRKGKSQVQEFFDQLSKAVTFDTFEPRVFVAQDNKVVVLGGYSGTAQPTGRRVQSDWAMVYTLRDGKIVRFREYTDSAAVNAAYAP